MLGECYAKSKDYDSAFQCFKKAVEVSKHSNHQALTFLGEYYMYGFGIDQDDKLAFQYFQKAVKISEQGNNKARDSIAAYNLLLLKHTGKNS